LVALPEKRAEIMTLITGIPDESQRLAAIRSALDQWSATSPAEAASWLDANMPEADTNLLSVVAERFSRVDPRANATWLIQRTPPDQREEAHGMALYQWSEAAPDEAAAWVESTGITDRACQILAGRFAPSDLEKAMSWARRVSPEKRADVFAENLATAIDAGRSPDVLRYAAEACITPEELSRKVQDVRELIGGR
jgi:hypothetical protein